MRVLALALLALLAIAGKSAAQIKASDPLEFYKGYLAVLAKGKSLDELVASCGREMQFKIALPRLPLNPCSCLDAGDLTF